ncbi:MAG: AsmA family protein [Planctomycetes bacterium]|nr:AsmA family protein [Planctomycetota bacterium]
MKKIIIILSSVFIFLFIAIIVAPFVVNLNKYKGRIITLAKPYLNREFDFTDVKLTIISGLGVEIKGLRIADNPEFGSEDFLSLQNLHIKLKLFPLIKKEIQIKKLIIEKPVVHMVRNSRGEFNFSDIVNDTEKTETLPARDGKKSGKKIGEREKPDSEKHDNNYNPFLAGLMVSQCIINQGQIHFLDNYVRDEPVTTVVDALEIEFQNVSLNKPISMYLSAYLPGETEQSFLIKGTLGPLGESMDIASLFMDINVFFKNILLNKFAPYIPEDLVIYPLEGIINMTANMRGAINSELDIESEIKGEKLTMSIKDANEKIQNVNFTLKEKIKYEDSKGGLVLQQLDVNLNGNAVSLTGNMKNIKTSPQWDLTLSSKINALDEVFAMYPALKEGLPQDFQITGPVNMEMNSKGNMDTMQISGHTEMSGAAITYGEIFQKPKQVPFQLSLKANKIADTVKLESLVINIQNASINSTGTIEGLTNPRVDLVNTTNEFSLKEWGAIVPLLKEYRPDGTIVIKNFVKGNLDDAFVNMQVSSPKLAFKLPASLSESEDQENKDKSKNEKQSEDFVELLSLELLAEKKADNINADMKADIKKGVVQNIDFEEMKGKFNFQNDILKIEDFQMKTFEGDISLAGDYDTASMKWNASPVINNVKVEGIVDSLTQYRGMMKGLFSGSFEMGGSLGNEERMVTSANGSFQLLQGEIENVNFMGTIIDSLLGMKELYKYAEKKKEVLEKYNVTRFDSLEGEVSLLNEKLDLKKCDLENIYVPEAPGSDAKLKGNINIDTGNLNLKGKVHLSPEHSEKLTKKAKPLNALVDEKGSIVLPVAVTGNMNKPKPLLDTKYVLTAIMNYYGKEEMEKGLNKLKEKIDLEKFGLDKLGLEKIWKKE